MNKKAASFASFLAVSCAIAAAAGERTLTVAADGSGDFKTVQAAIDAAPADSTTRTIIHIKPGTYKEKLVAPANRTYVTLRGDDEKTTILTNDWNSKHVGPDGKPVGTGGSCSARVEAGDFVAEHLTFENTAGDTGQAVALAAVGDRQVYRNCRLLGWQDTLYADRGRQLYDRCYIEGRVDFIFGSATAVFDHCQLHSKNGGHVTAASTPADHPFGYVFLDCQLTGDAIRSKDATAAAPPSAKPLPNADLGRPWRPYASVTFVRCEMGNHIKPAGWDNWRNPDNEKTARFAEYKCTGPGADRSRRVAWSRELSDDEAATLSVETLLAGDDHWLANR